MVRGGWQLGCIAALVAAWLVPGGATAPLEVATRARSYRPGEVVVVTVRAPAGDTGPVVTVIDREVPAFPDGEGRWRAIGGIDLDVTPGAYQVHARLGAAEATQALRVAPRQFAVRKLRVNPDFVNPPAAVQKRIEEEGQLVAAAYAAGMAAPAWSGAFLRPVPQAANSRFGTRSIFNGEPRNPHAGTDFLSPAGTPVKAPNAGRAVIARDLFFSGNTVIIDHGAGVFSQLAHLSRIDAREGAMVKAGEVVGLVGATGRVTGAHLHWGVRVSGTRVDALSLLAVLGEKSEK